MASRELDPRGRAGGLVEHGRALGRRRAQMRARDAVVLADVVDVAHLAGVAVDAELPVRDDGVVVPGSLPQLVDDVEELVGDLVAAVVRDLAVESEVPGRVRQIGGDDVPADPPARQVVERRHPSCERERRLVARREGDPEAEVLGDRRHRRDDEQRVVRGDLQPLADGRLGAPAEDVVRPHDIREEHAVEAAVLEQPRELEPVGDVLEAVPVVAGQRPQPVGDVAHRVHLEQVEDELLLLGHGSPFRPRRSSTTTRRGCR